MQWAHGICELWVKMKLKELGFNTQEPTQLYCGNKATINITHNLVQYYRTKHIKIDKHFIKGKLDEDIICTPFVKTGEQLTDILTKGVSHRGFHTILSMLVICDIFASA